MNKFLNKLAVGAGLAVAGGVAFAQSTGPDFSAIVSAVAIGSVSASIIAMGAVKIVPNVTRWATNKLVSFFR
ncbi:hypothetical protein OR16_34713 [Cupriavidus basilensis OR16]|uniref:Uncharacterized protein n=1 Tax=Cupriavidus basilensis OR16 TaxID=1127483 RepID=H1SF41_9BURK|nr:hypothetical protein [Cupriavidus basilensis]EHP38866.1 hypothetical protein OR16_34713 [Cupriavidus basilensis OR16]